MMNKILLLSLIMAFSFGANLNFFGNTAKYDGYQFGVKFADKKLVDDDLLNYSLGSVWTDSTHKLAGILNYDMNESKRFGQFAFIGYDKNDSLSYDYMKMGCGVSYLFSKNVLTYPFRQKASIAIIAYGVNGNYINFRYKLKGYHNKYFFDFVANLSAYRSDAIFKIGQNIQNDFSWFAQFGYENLHQIVDNSSMFGLEVEL